MVGLQGKARVGQFIELAQEQVATKTGWINKYILLFLFFQLVRGLSIYPQNELAQTEYKCLEAFSAGHHFFQDPLFDKMVFKVDSFLALFELQGKRKACHEFMMMRVVKRSTDFEDFLASKQINGPNDIAAGVDFDKVLQQVDFDIFRSM